MTTQLFLNRLLFTTQLFKDGTNLNIVLFIYIEQCNQ